MSGPSQGDHVTDYDITEAMIVFGGRFASALGHAFRFADAENQRRLKKAFPEMWREFGDVVVQANLQMWWQKQTETP